MFLAKRVKARQDKARRLVKRLGIPWQQVDTYLGVDFMCADATSLDRLIARLETISQEEKNMTKNTKTTKTTTTTTKNAKEDKTMKTTTKTATTKNAKEEKTMKTTTKDTTTKTATSKRMTVAQVNARVDDLFAAVTALTEQVGKLAIALTANAQATAKPATTKTTTKAKTTTAKTTTTTKKPAAKTTTTKAAKMPAPTREEWLAYRDEHKNDSEYVGMTKHDRNSALYKALLESRKG